MSLGAPRRTDDSRGHNPNRTILPIITTHLHSSLAISRQKRPSASRRREATRQSMTWEVRCRDGDRSVHPCPVLGDQRRDASQGWFAPPWRDSPTRAEGNIHRSRPKRRTGRNELDRHGRLYTGAGSLEPASGRGSRDNARRSDRRFEGPPTRSPPFPLLAFGFERRAVNRGRRSCHRRCCRSWHLR